MSADHFFMSNAKPIANFTDAEIRMHVPVTANAMTVSNGVSTGALWCSAGSHVKYAGTTPFTMIERSRGGSDRCGVAHTVGAMRLYTSNMVDSLVSLAFPSSDNAAYTDVFFSNVSDNRLHAAANVMIGGSKMLTWGSGTGKYNMIQFWGDTTANMDATYVTSLGATATGIFIYNSPTNTKFYAGDNLLVNLSNASCISYSDTQLQSANMIVYAGYARTTVGVVRCQPIGGYTNKLCLYAPAGTDPLDRLETGCMGLGTANNTLLVRCNGQSTDGYTIFKANTNICGIFGYGPITGNGATGNSGRFRLGGTGFPAWNLYLEMNSACKPATATWSAPSDRRLKTDIEPANLDTCYDTVRALPLKRFRWREVVGCKTADQRVTGWIAQDVEHLIPKAVTVTGDYGIDDFRALNQDQILKTMYGALQRAMAKIETLETALGEAETALGHAKARAREVVAQ